MKVNQTKAIVACLGIAAAAAIAGSVSGTVAWFQYNTRVTAAYVGTSATTTSNLQIKVGNGPYTQKLTSADIEDYLTGVGNNTDLHPITLGANQLADAALPAPLKFYSNPLYQYFGYSAWREAPATQYVQLPLTVKYTAVSDSSALASKDVWLTDLTIQNHEGESGDLYKALRVHVAATDKHLFSAEDAAVKLGGALDLNNDGQSDIDDTSRVHYDFVSGGSVGIYGDASATLNSIAYAGSGIAPADAKGVLTEGDPIGQTDANGELAITVTIWLEGWHLLEDTRTLTDTVANIAARDAISPAPSAGAIYKVTDTDLSAEGDQTKWYIYDGNGWAETTDPESPSATWENSYIGKMFDVGLRFSVSANAAA